jgi:hypothetical protein
MLDNAFLPAPRETGDSGASLAAPDGNANTNDDTDDDGGLQTAPGNTIQPSGRPGR